MMRIGPSNATRRVSGDVLSTAPVAGVELIDDECPKAAETKTNAIPMPNVGAILRALRNSLVITISLIG
jgi:hypothetical protein